MLYAKVVLGISVEGPFDYSVPAGLEKVIRVGSRVKVTLRTQRCIGYVVGLSRKTYIKKVKPLLSVIDEEPILDADLLKLTRELADYYCCSWGEAIETAIPQALRSGKALSFKVQGAQAAQGGERKDISLIHGQDAERRWDFYIEAIKEALLIKKQVIVLLPDIEKVYRAKELISSRIGITPAVFFRKEAHELEEWVKAKEGRTEVILGTRSAIFAPFNNAGLVIVDDEDDFVYKQDQVPHYHAREAAFMRCRLDKAGLMLGSHTPSLESFLLAEEGKINYVFIPRQAPFPQVTISDSKYISRLERKKSPSLSRYLQDAISGALNEKGKILLFLNRKGFATFAHCSSCGALFKCPRCNINLVYHFKEASLNCHYCNYSTPAPKVCPECNSGYIKYSGAGMEKVESELALIFPQARVKVVDDKSTLKLDEADIFIATESILGENISFDLVAALAIDNSLNRVDLRAAERTFRLLNGLARLAKSKMLIQTRIPHHHAFLALSEKDPNIFYAQELKQRKQLHFPPYAHMGLVKIRGRKESSVKESSSNLFERLKERNKGSQVKILGLRPADPAKLRGNFYWQILLSARSAEKITGFLKINLKDFRHSGIIVTVDIDPL